MKRKDKDLEIIERVLAEPVPNRGEIGNPFKKNTSSSSYRQLSMHDAEEHQRFPVDPDDWTLKKLVEYFEYCMKKHTGLNYRGVYRTDCPSFQKYSKHFVDQGLHRYLWCKELIDWAVEHRAEIVKRHKHLTVQTLEHVLNEFIQEKVMPLVEDETIERSETPDEPLLEEMEESFGTMKRLDFFAKFGIPLAFTFCVNVRNEDPEKLMTGMEKAVIGALGNTAVIDQLALQSIANAPYPKWMLMQDWRNKLPDISKRANAQRWWRDEDFRGKPLAKYDVLKRTA